MLALQVPSKYALDAALRCFTTAASADGNVRAWLINSGHVARVLAPLVLLMQHHSARVQLRALQLLRTLVLRVHEPELMQVRNG